MDYQGTPKLETLPEQETSQDKSATDKNKSSLRVLQARLKAEQKARLKAEKALADAQVTLSIIQTELEHVQQKHGKAEQNLVELQDQLDIVRTQLKEQHQARIQAEQEKAEVEKALENAAINYSWSEESKQSLSLPRLHSGEQSVIFVIRLVVDERGQTKRTVIKHVQSSKEDVFASFDVQRLVDFITSTIAPISTPEEQEPIAQINPLSSKESRTRNPEVALKIKDLQITCTDKQGEPEIIFEAAKPIFIQTLFQIDESDSLPEASRIIPYDINIYAMRIDDQSTSLIATESATLASGIYEYRSKIQIPGLPAGLFRLVNVLSLRTPVNIARGVQGPFVQIRPT